MSIKKMELNTIGLEENDLYIFFNSLKNILKNNILRGIL